MDKSQRDGRSDVHVQPSLRDSTLFHPCPGVETPGYSQPSLRDDLLEMLVALGCQTCGAQRPPVQPAELTFCERFGNESFLAFRCLRRILSTCKSRSESRSSFCSSGYWA